MNLREASVLVTGATGGIGAAVVAELAGCGARIVLSGRNESRLNDLAARTGGRAVVAELVDAGEVAALAEAAGPVDVLVHCAGVGWRGTFESTDATQLVQVNLTAPMLLTAALLPAMRERGCGHLAYVGSIAGLVGVRDEAVYAATKAGLLGFAASLRAELAGSGVTVSTISPAAVDTGFWAARGTPYHRRRPALVPASRVARRLLRDIGRDADRIDPRWLVVASLMRTASPRLYAALARRMDAPSAFSD